LSPLACGDDGPYHVHHDDGPYHVYHDDGPYRAHQRGRELQLGAGGKLDANEPFGSDEDFFGCGCFDRRCFRSSLTDLT